MPWSNDSKRVESDKVSSFVKYRHSISDFDFGRYEKFNKAFHKEGEKVQITYVYPVSRWAWRNGSYGELSSGTVLTKLEINYKIDRMRRGGPRRSDFMDLDCILRKSWKAISLWQTALFVSHHGRKLRLDIRDLFMVSWVSGTRLSHGFIFHLKRIKEKKLHIISKNSHLISEIPNGALFYAT